MLYLVRTFSTATSRLALRSKNASFSFFSSLAYDLRYHSVSLCTSTRASCRAVRRAYTSQGVVEGPQTRG